MPAGYARARTPHGQAGRVLSQGYRHHALRLQPLRRDTPILSDEPHALALLAFICTRRLMPPSVRTTLSSPRLPAVCRKALSWTSARRSRTGAIRITPPDHRASGRGAGRVRVRSGRHRESVQLRYDGKRRIRLPVIGSVKMVHTLPKGIPYEAHISCRNGQWVLSVKYWRGPTAQSRARTLVCQRSAVDTGISPMATDSEGQVWREPEGVLPG